MIFLVTASYLLNQVLGDLVVNGVIVRTNNYKWLASIQVGNHHLCSGTIISEKIILTAAHCTTQYSINTMKIRVGSDELDSGGSRHDVAGIIRHDSHIANVSPYIHDVALIKVSPSFEFGLNVQKVNLANRNDVVEAGRVASIVGWGQVSERELTPNSARSTSLKIVDKMKCRRKYGNTPYTSWIMSLTGFRCAVETGKAACDGDFGSPLMTDDVQVGIMSWSNGWARSTEYPWVYADVAFYRDWIDINRQAWS